MKTNRFLSLFGLAASFFILAVAPQAFGAGSLTVGNTNADFGGLNIITGGNGNITASGTGAITTTNGNISVGGAGIFSGNGSGLTNLPGGNIVGAIPAASLTSVPAASLTGAIPAASVTYKAVRTVAQTGGMGDYTDPVAAMADAFAGTTWCGAAPSPANRCLLKIMPGVYNLTAPLWMQQYVDIEGAGEFVTELKGSFSCAVSPPSPGCGVVNGADFAEIRFLSIENNGSVGGAGTAGMVNMDSAGNGVLPRLTHVRVGALFGPGDNYGIYNKNLPVAPWPLSMHYVTAQAFGGTNAYAIYNDSADNAFMTNTVATSGYSSNNNYSIYNTNSSPLLDNIVVFVSGLGTIATTNYGVYNASNSKPTMANIKISVDGGGVAGSSSYGIYNDDASPIITHGIIDAKNGAANSIGIRNTGNSGSNPQLQNIIANGDNGINGLGIYNEVPSSPTLVNVTTNGIICYDSGCITQPSSTINIDHSVINRPESGLPQFGIDNRNGGYCHFNVGASRVDGGRRTSGGNCFGPVTCLYDYCGPNPGATGNIIQLDAVCESGNCP